VRRGDKPIKLGYSWFSAKCILVQRLRTRGGVRWAARRLGPRPAQPRPPEWWLVRRGAQRSRVERETAQNRA
jgi:hypothetical protein